MGIKELLFRGQGVTEVWSRSFRDSRWFYTKSSRLQRISRSPCLAYLDRQLQQWRRVLISKISGFELKDSFQHRISLWINIDSRCP